MNNLEIIKLICDIGTAVGTVGTVIVALWLSLRSKDHVTGKIWIFQDKIIDSKTGNTTSQISVRLELIITNTGEKIINIRRVGVKVKYSRSSIFFVNEYITTSQPIKLEPGIAYSKPLNLKDFKEHTFSIIEKNYFLKIIPLILVLPLVKIIVVSSTGSRYFLKIDRHVRRILREPHNVR